MVIFHKIKLVFLLMLVPIFSSSAHGQIELSFSPASVTASDAMNTGSIEIFATHELSVDPELTGFQVEFSIFGAEPTESQIAATGVFDPSDRDYVFAPASTGPIGNITDQGTTVMLGDFLISGSAPLESGQSLGRFDFELDFASAGLVDHTIRIDTDPSRTFLIDQDNNPIAFTANDGTIQVNAVPESSSLLILSFVAGVSLLRRRRAAVA